MKIRFSVKALPPKKDGANSMWRKGTEMPRLKSLRRAASIAMGSNSTVQRPVALEVRIYAHPRDGDLDNFVTGICDGLMAAHPQTPIDPTAWNDLPIEARPSRSIVFRDDSVVSRIQAERLPPDYQGVRYGVELEWDE